MLAHLKIIIPTQILKVRGEGFNEEDRNIWWNNDNRMASQVHLVEYIITTLDHLYRYTLVLQLSGSPVVQQSRISSSGETLLWSKWG